MIKQFPEWHLKTFGKLFSSSSSSHLLSLDSCCGQVRSYLHWLLESLMLNLERTIVIPSPSSSTLFSPPDETKSLSVFQSINFYCFSFPLPPSSCCTLSHSLLDCDKFYVYALNSSSSLSSMFRLCRVAIEPQQIDERKRKRKGLGPSSRQHSTLPVAIIFNFYLSLSSSLSFTSPPLANWKKQLSFCCRWNKFNSGISLPVDLTERANELLLWAEKWKIQIYTSHVSDREKNYTNLSQTIFWTNSRLRLNQVLINDGYDIEHKRFPEGYQEAPLAYDAVWSVALAFNKTMERMQGKSRSLKDFTYTDKDIADEIYAAMNSTQFLGVSVSLLLLQSAVVRMMKSPRWP